MNFVAAIRLIVGAKAIAIPTSLLAGSFIKEQRFLLVNSINLPHFLALSFIISCFSRFTFTNTVGLGDGIKDEGGIVDGEGIVGGSGIVGGVEIIGGVGFVGGEAIIGGT